VNWSFPEISQFPSGIDGEQMHQVFGELYFKSFYDIYKKKNQRIYFDVRSSDAFASHNATSLYSDTYDHKEYIRMIANEGFSGLLWSPEVRESNSVTELIRRSQTAVLSAQTLFNSWYLQNPPWLQFDTSKNNKGILLKNADEVEGQIRELLNFRMSLIPYLYTAFAQYNQQGIPPFRALVMDYPEDKNVFDLSDEYMIGESLLAAPIIGESPARTLYLPKGNWYDFNTNKKYEGGKKYTVNFDLNQLPLFVKEGTILPFAKPVEFISDATVFDITCRIYGNIPAKATLFEDDGVTYNFSKGDFNIINLSFSNGKGHYKREGNFMKKLYQISKWEYIQ
jgi:alpha-D-xyloside xylohydrolase